jgi:hypothetical protein
LLAIAAAAVALKTAVAAPAATVTDPGTVSKALLLAGEMTMPPAGAAKLSAAEQVETWPPLRLPGTQVIEESAGTATTPPDAVIAGIPKPVAVTPTGFDTPIDVVAALAAIFTWTLATTPEAMVLVFKPVSTQLRRPAAEAQ